MEVLSKTLKNYKNTYANRLAKYLDDYEDNSELLFLQKELKSCGEALETLNAYKTNCKTFGFQKLKDEFDISILENLGFNLNKLDNHIVSLNHIIDFINNKIKNPKESNALEEVLDYPVTIQSENPYPRIFINEDAYKIFKNLKSEFGVSSTTMADYSYVYHKMLKDGFIYNDYKQTEFVFFLLDFDINIDRIKSWNQIGKKRLRNSIYLKAKDKSKTVS